MTPWLENTKVRQISEDHIFFCASLQQVWLVACLSVESQLLNINVGGKKQVDISLMICNFLNYYTTWY